MSLVSLYTDTSSASSELLKSFTAKERDHAHELVNQNRILEFNVQGILLSCRIFLDRFHKTETRIKLHPSRKFIQWMECTCPVARKNEHFCEHTSALIIHCLTHHPQILNLLIGNPVPLPVRKTRIHILNSHKDDSIKQTSELYELENAKTLHATPIPETSRFKLEVVKKDKSTKLYECSLDTLGDILSHATSVKSNFRIIADATAHLGKTYHLGADHSLLVRTKLIFEIQNHVEKTFRALKGIGAFAVESLFKWSSKGKSTKPNDAIIFDTSSEKSKVSFGEAFIFLQPHFLIPFTKNQLLPGELTKIKHIDCEESLLLIKTQFSDVLNQHPIWIHEDIVNLETSEDLTLSGVEILKKEGDWFYLHPSYVSKDLNLSLGELLRLRKKIQDRIINKNNILIRVPKEFADQDWEIDPATQAIKVDKIGLLKIKAALKDGKFKSLDSGLVAEAQNSTEHNYENFKKDVEKSGLDLRQYQKEGVAWLWWLFKNKLSGLLADDMGLGKTHQAMALMSLIVNFQEESRFLVVVPTTVLDHWITKVKEFAPQLNPVKHFGSDRTQKLTAELSKNSKSCMVVTSYGILLRDIKLFQKQKWSIVLLDEAHYVKNHKTLTYKAACSLNSDFRLCLSGTPVENSLNELKNIFDFLLPGYLGSSTYFKRHFLIPIVTRKDLQKSDELQKIINPLKLRRTKQQVLSDLPEKIIDLRYCQLSDDQLKIYRQILDTNARPLIAKLSENSGKIPYLHVFSTLQLLKQVCDHPALFDESLDYKKYKSSKFELFKDILQEALDGDNKVVIFSQYLNMIKIIENYCADHSIECISLTGASKERGKIVGSFQNNPNIKVFIGSLLAGGIGIDLTSASVVIHYDRWWNASKENQATDRVHRIGQKKFVQVVKLITQGTLEEKIHALISEKSELIDTFLRNDEDILGTLKRDQLIELLS